MAEKAELDNAARTSIGVFVRAVVCGFLLGILCELLTVQVLGALPEFWATHRALVNTIVALAGTNFVLIGCRPQQLRCSRWRLGSTELLLAAVVGYVAQSLTFLLFPQPAPHVDWVLVMCLVVVGPVLEEIFCRVFLLRTLLAVWPPWLSLAVVSIGAALSHYHFSLALLPQLAFSILYWKDRNSAGAAIVCHSVTNIVVLFPSLNLMNSSLR